MLQTFFILNWNYFILIYNYFNLNDKHFKLSCNIFKINGSNFFLIVIILNTDHLFNLNDKILNWIAIFLI